MKIKKKPYEISLWEDKLTKVTVHDPQSSYDKQYYKETRIATIGSDKMIAPIRAYSPLFNKNVNGTKTLSFTIASRYFDEEIGDYAQNPYIGLLINERKVKLKYEGDWHVFYIKEIIEDSTKSTFTIHCKDSYINELSKTGYKIELDSESQNNQGTIIELAETIVAETDWTIDKDGSDIIKQYIEEPIYKARIKSAITLRNMENLNETLSVASGKDMFLFYSTLSAADPYCQVIYRADGLYEVDDDRNIVNSKNWVVDGNVTYSGNTPSFVNTMAISNEYRGKRLVRKGRTVFDPLLERVVNLYKTSGGQEVRGYEEFTVLDTRLAANIITNGEDFITAAGWSAGSTATVSDYIYPPITQNTNFSETFYPFLKMKFAGSASRIYNTGLTDNRSTINGLVKGEKYVFNIKHNLSATATTPLAANAGIRAQIAEYTLVDGVYTLGTVYVNFTGNLTNLPKKDGDKFAGQYIIAEVSESLSYKDMLSKKVGIFLRAASNYNVDYYVEGVEIFPFFPDTIGSEPFLHYSNLTYLHPTATTYYYYTYNPLLTDADQISYLYKGLTPSNLYTKVYTNNFEKVRSITAKQSNVYNLIQSLCETFECWAKFEILHNPDTGELILDDNFLPTKKISFHEFVGQDNPRGFRYGINLDGIQRTLNSDSIVTKLIVEPNSNQFAPHGFATIARAEENPTKQNTILDFKYYINQGLLDFSEVMNDLWLDSPEQGYVGYYKRLNQINKNLDTIIEEIIQLSTNQITEESLLQTYTIAYDETQNSLAQLLNEIRSYTGYTYEQIKANDPSGAKDKLKNTVVANMATEIETLKHLAQKFLAFKGQAADNLDALNSTLYNKKEELSEMYDQNFLVEHEFYKKYSRFLQEGSWISEDYIDDNLYYLDAGAVLAESAMPAVTYTIKVLELSQVEGYENYIFELGDKTYIEDTEFFGWITIDGMKTPYKEEIVISNIVYDLDSPENNVITVQNFKTQFEDLFQRITATTQSLQYASGSYARAAGILDPEGTIKTKTLESSFKNNSFILSNARDQSVVWDESGITITNLRKPNEIIRLVSGGIFISDTGGSVWTGAVTGSGINTNELTAGTINTSHINISSGSYPAFRWDDKGLSAYQFSRDNQGIPQYFNFNKFVRFDQYGIYGYWGVDPNGEGFYPESEEEIRDNAQFSLTWTGFSLKGSKDNEGLFSISSDRDLEIFRANNNLALHLGKLDQGHYGLELFDLEGNTTLITTDQGEMRSGNYSSGFRGWSINKDGSVEFEDALIRGALKSTVFTYDEVNAQGGSLVISRSAVLADDLLITGSTVTFETKEEYGGIFAMGDTIRVLTHVSNNIKANVWLQIAATNGNSYTATILNRTPNEDYTLLAGTPLVSYGKKNDGIILLKADDATSGPYIDILRNTSTDVHNLLNQERMLRLGDLSTVNDPSFGIFGPEGYGLYTSNAFITGTVALPQAGITDYRQLDPNGAPIEGHDNVRIWAGGTYSDLIISPNSLPFRVYESGKVAIGKSVVGSSSFVFDPVTKEIILSGARILNSSHIDLPDIEHKVIILGGDIKQGDESTTLQVLLYIDGVDMTSAMNANDFEWFLGGVSIGTGKTKTILSSEVNGSAQISCVFTAA